MGRRRALLVFSVALLIGGAIYYGRAVGSVRPSPSPVSGQDPDLPDLAVADALQQSLSVADGVLAEALAKMERDASAAPSGQEQAKVEQPASRSGCEWGKSVPRSSDLDRLVDEFLMGSVSIRQIKRHKVLNWTDRPLCPDEEAALAVVVERYNRFMKPILSAYRNVRTNELLALIKEGRIPEWESEPATDQDVARYAALLEGSGETPEEARKQAEQARQHLRSTPRGSYIKENGKYYLRPPASSLPLSAAYYADIKFISLDRIQVVIAWFASNGFTVDAEGVTRLCKRIDSRLIE